MRICRRRNFSPRRCFRRAARFPPSSPAPTVECCGVPPEEDVTPVAAFCRPSSLLTFRRRRHEAMSLIRRNGYPAIDTSAHGVPYRPLRFCVMKA